MYVCDCFEASEKSLSGMLTAGMGAQAVPGLQERAMIGVREPRATTGPCSTIHGMTLLARVHPPTRHSFCTLPFRQSISHQQMIRILAP